MDLLHFRVFIIKSCSCISSIKGNAIIMVVGISFLSSGFVEIGFLRGLDYNTMIYHYK